MCSSTNPFIHKDIIDFEVRKCFATFGLDILRPSTKNILSLSLNPKKYIPADNGLPRDWRGLAETIGLPSIYISNCDRKENPSLEILHLWINNKALISSSIISLLRTLEKIDRFDIIDDISPFIEADIIYVKYQQNTAESNPLDVFILNAEEDYCFAQRIVQFLEANNGLKVYFPTRDMPAGVLDIPTRIMTAGQCKYLIIVLSPAFFNCQVSSFCARIAQCMIPNGSKIIPILYKPCCIPKDFGFLVFFTKLNYFHNKNDHIFWERLMNTLVFQQQISHTQAEEKMLAVSQNEGLVKLNGQDMDSDYYSEEYLANSAMVSMSCKRHLSASTVHQKNILISLLQWIRNKKTHTTDGQKRKKGCRAMDD